MLVIWKERASPLRARRAARRCVTSSPAKKMRPLSGRRSPASWLMKVVLPAPFGPMIACVSPSRTARSMRSLARSAPKVFVRARTSSVALEDAGEAPLEEDDRHHEERPEDREGDRPVRIGREADGARAGLIGFRRPDHHAEARVGDPVNQEKRA